jgi:hypothetical protein
MRTLRREMRNALAHIAEGATMAGMRQQLLTGHVRVIVPYSYSGDTVTCTVLGIEDKPVANVHIRFTEDELIIREEAI